MENDTTQAQQGTGQQLPDNGKQQVKIHPNEVVKLRRSVLKDEGARFNYRAMQAAQNTDADVKHLNYVIDKGIQQRDDRQKIINEANSLRQGILKSFHAGLTADIQQLEKWQSDFKAAYVNHRLQALDPQAELLKRQDFDVSLAAMSDQDLAEYVNSLAERPKLSAYELNKLMLRVQSSPQLKNKVIGYKAANHYGHEYEEAPEWNRVSMMINTLKSWQSGDNVWYWGQDGRLQLLDVSKLLLDKLKDYHVADPSQR